MVYIRALYTLTCTLAKTLVQAVRRHMRVHNLAGMFFVVHVMCRGHHKSPTLACNIKIDLADSFPVVYRWKPCSPLSEQDCKPLFKCFRYRRDYKTLKTPVVS